MDAPYEVVISNVVFSNHSSSGYGDYTLRGPYEKHNKKILQSYGEKGLWIVPRIDLTRYVIENISFVNPKNAISLKVIGGEWIQNATTFRDSDLSNVEITSMKAFKYEYFQDYWYDDEASNLALLNTIYDDSRLNIDGHLNSDGTSEYDAASLETKYYFDLNVEGISGNKIKGAEVYINSSNILYPSESLYEYRTFISDAFGPGQGGVSGYGPDSPQNETYTGGVYTRWYNALPLGSATTDSTGHTSLPTSSDLNNSIVLIDFVLSNETGTLKKESLTYSMNVKTPDDQVITLSDIDPDPSWYREDPSVPTYTITAVIPDNTTGPHITGFAPAEDNQFTQGETKKFRVWTDEPLTTMKWYVDGNLVSIGSLQYNWTVADDSHTVVFQGSNTGGTVVQSWSVSAESGGPVLSSDGTTYTPSSTSLATDIGDSTTFSISTDQPLMSLDWYVDGEIVESGVMEYTHEWSAAGIHSVRLEGDAGTETISNTWSVVVSEAGSSTISVLPSSAVVAPGDTFSLDVNIDPATSLSGSQFDMHYSSIASVDSVHEGELFSGSGLSTTFYSGDIDDFASVLSGVYSAIVSSGTISAPGTMATVNMVAGSSTGVLELALSDVVLSDANSNPAPYKVSNATVLVDSAPVFDHVDPVSAVEGDVILLPVSATDPDGDSLSYSCTSLPDGASFNPTTAIMSWTPEDGDAGDYSAVFEVTDGYLNDSVSVTISVTDIHPRWDINEDGDVNASDIVLVRQNFGNKYSDDLPRWDVNQDGIVNIQDVSIVASRFESIE